MVFCFPVPYTLGVKLHTRKRTTLQLAGAGLLVITLGIIIGWFAHGDAGHAATVTPKLVRENSFSYKFINPIILAQVPENTSIPEFQTLKKNITAYITTAKADKNVADASVYFRQLNTDSWIGVNVDDLYAPASMLKAVSLISFLHAVQQNPSLYTTTTAITSQDVNTNINQDYYSPKDPIEVGETYPSSELLSYMIINSDNTAANAVNDILGTSALNQTYSDLTLPVLTSTTPADFMSPKMFSRVFRTLYNGAYLSGAVSEQALDLMSKTTFTQGLVAGVPFGTVVSHKFGERTLTTKNADGTSTTVRELHDCGIVYAPNDPYLLCVMTKGNAFTSLQKVIADISAMSWQSVQHLDSQKG